MKARSLSHKVCTSLRRPRSRGPRRVEEGVKLFVAALLKPPDLCVKNIDEFGELIDECITRSDRDSIYGSLVLDDFNFLPTPDE